MRRILPIIGPGAGVLSRRRVGLRCAGSASNAALVKEVCRGVLRSSGAGPAARTPIASGAPARPVHDDARRVRPAARRRSCTGIGRARRLRGAWVVGRKGRREPGRVRGASRSATLRRSWSKRRTPGRIRGAARCRSCTGIRRRAARAGRTLGLRARLLWVRWRCCLGVGAGRRGSGGHGRFGIEGGLLRDRLPRVALDSPAP